MELIRVDKRTVQSVFDFTRDILKRFPTRIPGSKNSGAAGEAITEHLKGFCDSAYAEPFKMYPGSLFNIGRVMVAVYVLTFVLLCIGGGLAYISLVLNALTLAYAVVHYFFYGKTFDRLFNERPGKSAVGIIEPTGKIEQQVIVVGHHDSPYVFGFLEHLGSLAGIRFILGVLFYFYMVGLSFAAGINVIFQGGEWTLRGALLIIALIGLLFVLPLFFFITKKESPGAGDNLNGSSMAIVVGRYFSAEKLRNTRVIVLSTDGEEAGQRGAAYYAKKHLAEMKATPTFVFNIDSVYKTKDLALMVRDKHGIKALSKRMAADCFGLADALGYRLQRVDFPFGSGTDAAAFACEGIEAISVIGMSASAFADQHLYHTTRDTLDKIEPEAVEAVLNIGINYILQKDAAAGEYK